MTITPANAISALKTASSLALNQKNVAFFKEDPSWQPNEFGVFNFDTTPFLNSQVEEILAGGKSGLDSSLLDGLSAYVLNAEPMEAQGVRSSRTFEHPLEWNANDAKEVSTSDGERSKYSAQNFITDHSIELPATFYCQIAMPSFLYTSIIDELKDLLSKKTLVRIVAKGDVYRNMVLLSFSKPLTVQTLSRMVISTQWREIQLNYEDSKEAQ